MRVILIIFLILFLIVSSLFLTTFISKISPNDQDMLLAAEYGDNTSTDIITGDSNINNISDIEPDTISDLEGLGTPEREESMGSGSNDNGESDEEDGRDDGSNTSNSEESADNNIEIIDQDNTVEEDDPGEDTVKIYLDGDRDNGIYLGAATYGIGSSRAEELYGTEFKETGFRFEWKNTTLEIEPGSTHFLYIYYYSKKSGWDYIRKEVNIPGQKTGNSDIKIFIDHPKEQEAINELAYMDGWALDAGTTDNTGISKIKIYLDGPMDFGRHLGDADYGIPRQGVADFFKNNNYLYSGYSLSLSALSLEEGTKHTIFIYAIDSSNPNIFNFEKRDIFLEGKRYILIIISFINILLYYSAYAYYDTILDSLAKYDLPLGLLTFLKYFIIFVLGFSIGFLITLGMRLRVSMNYYDIKVLVLVGFIPALAIIISYSGIANLLVNNVFNSNTTISELYFYFFSRTDIWAIWLGIAAGSSIRLKLLQKRKYRHEAIE